MYPTQAMCLIFPGCTEFQPKHGQKAKPDHKFRIALTLSSALYTDLYFRGLIREDVCVNVMLLPPFLA